MLIKLTNQVVDISLDNIKEIHKRSMWLDTRCTNNFISIYYKTNFEHRIKCDSKAEVEADYNTIVSLLDTKSGEMTNKDIDICKRVILDIILELEQKEDNAEFVSDGWNAMMDRLSLIKALDIINKKEIK